MAIYDYEGNNIVISNFVNVISDYGAKGNGVADDSAAIQTAIDSLMVSGGIIYFPKGTYLLKSSLIFYSNQTLWFENGAKLLAGISSLNNLLRTYCDNTITGYNGVHDCLIYGATFDGGTGLNDTLLATVHSKNITIEKCTFVNAGYGYHNIEINSSYNVKIIDCDHEGLRKQSENGEMIQLDVAAGSTVYPWDDINGDGTVCKYIEISGCIFHDNIISPAIGNHNGTMQFINIHDNVFDGLTSERGAINIGATNLNIYNNIFNGCTIGIGSSGATHYIHDNSFVGVTTAISGSTSVAHNNMINGTFTA